MEFFQLDRFWAGAFMALAVVGAIRLLVEVERSRAGQNVAKFLSERVGAAYTRTPKSAFALIAISGWAAVLTVTCILVWADIASCQRVVTDNRDVQRHQDGPGEEHHRRQGGEPGSERGLKQVLEFVYRADTRLAAFNRFAKALPGGATSKARPVVDGRGLPPSLPGSRFESCDVANETAACSNHHAAKYDPADGPPERPQDQAGQQHQNEPHVSAWNIHTHPPLRSPAQHSAKAGA